MEGLPSLLRSAASFSVCSPVPRKFAKCLETSEGHWRQAVMDERSSAVHGPRDCLPGETRQFDFERHLASGLSKQGNPEQIRKQPKLMSPPLLYFWHLPSSSVVCSQAYSTFILSPFLHNVSKASAHPTPGWPSSFSHPRKSSSLFLLPHSNNL